MNDPNPMEFYHAGRHTKRPEKRQIMDGDVLVGTIERDRQSGGVYAVLEETGEQEWFKSGDAARAWLIGTRVDNQDEADREFSYSLRHQWDYPN